jgi:hypothetical protein
MAVKAAALSTYNMPTAKKKNRPVVKAAPKAKPKSPPPSVAKGPAKAAAKPPPKPAPRPVAAKPPPKPAPRPVAVKPPPKPVPVKAADKTEAVSPSQPQPFRLVAIERTEPPMGADGKNWYRYTITQGANAINGYLQGTATGVKNAAEQIVGQLNERRAGRWGYRTTRAAAPAQAG